MMYSRDKFYAPGNKLKTKSLFIETCQLDRRHNAIFTNALEDRDEYVSLYKLYMAYTLDDPSEYTFAEIVFGDWITWEQISNAPTIRNWVNEWRSSNAVRQKSIAIKAMIEKVKAGEKDSFLAAKVLLAKGWQDQPKSKSAKEKDEEETKIAMANLYEDDATRLGLSERLH
jgi:hypothetical protein